MFLVQASAQTPTVAQFGIFDDSRAPPGDAAWVRATMEDLTAHKRSFLDDYNSEAGLPIIAPFQADKCCVTVLRGRGQSTPGYPHGHKGALTITGTAFGFQFPAALGQAQSAACESNGTDGTLETLKFVRFHRVDKLERTQKFGVKPAQCLEKDAETGEFKSNPGLYVIRPAPAHDAL